MQNKLDILFQLFRAIRGPNTHYFAGATTKQGSMVQWPTVSLGTQGWIVEVRSSSRDMMAFTENSLGHKRMRQARSDSYLYDSCAIFDMMTLARAEKVTLMWGMDIPWPVHFLFLFLEAWKSSSSEGS